MADLEESVEEDLRNGLEQIGFDVDDVNITTIVQGGAIGKLNGDERRAEHPAEAHRWTAKAEHVGAESGLPPTNRDVKIEGITIVYQPDGDRQFLRVIDWAGVHAQLGFVLETRPLAPLDPLKEPVAES